MNALLHSAFVVGALMVYGLWAGLIAGVGIGWIARGDWELWLKARRRKVGGRNDATPLR
jgi:cytochrome b